ERPHRSRELTPLVGVGKVASACPHRAAEPIHSEAVVGLRPPPLELFEGLEHLWVEVARDAESQLTSELIHAIVLRRILEWVEEHVFAKLIEIGRASCRERVEIEVGAG